VINNREGIFNSSVAQELINNDESGKIY
jgi:hypothetical protein